MSHRVTLSSLVLRSFSAITGWNLSVNSWARSSLSCPHVSCDEGSCFGIAFRSVVILISPALGGIEPFLFFVPPRMVCTSDLPGTVGGVIPRESPVWPRSMFCATRGDHWDGTRDVVSVICDRVRKGNSTQNASPTTPVLECH
jgi:hypothetical protein